MRKQALTRLGQTKEEHILNSTLYVMAFKPSKYFKATPYTLPSTAASVTQKAASNPNLIASSKPVNHFVAQSATPMESVTGSTIASYPVNQSAKYVRKGNSLVRANPNPSKSNETARKTLASAPGRPQTPPLSQSRGSTPPPTNVWCNSRPNSCPSTPPRGNSRPPTPPLNSQPGVLSAALSQVYFNQNLNQSLNQSLNQNLKASATGLTVKPSLSWNACKSENSDIPPDSVTGVTIVAEKFSSTTPPLVQSPPRVVAYRKSKANQLVATTSIGNTTKGEVSASAPKEYVRSDINKLVAVNMAGSLAGDQRRGFEGRGYVKKGTNQIIRGQSSSTFQGSLSKPSHVKLDGGVYSQAKYQLKRLPITRFSRALAKSLPLGLSRVWKLGMIVPQRSQLGPKTVPFAKSVHQVLLPWKRPAYAFYTKFQQKRVSAFGRQLEKQRNMQMLYTRSGRGLSLHRSGVRSVAGSNITWTKSKDEKIKLANKEATKTLAAISKRRFGKTQSKTGSNIPPHAKPRDKIVTVGLIRYKMDSSGHTLQLLTDSPAANSGTSVLPLEVPRRASVGGTSYVCAGNGNQLVRDPKALSKALASERVRYSLHNARVRKAKPKSFCQFYTRFGKCKKKDTGECRYIHDPDKIAVCTKFIRGACSNSNCLLTHKVVVDRMPDCSYFLQGMCTNEECPYRHVNVNSQAPVCEGFLKGYCEKGDLCDKKHTYICPSFLATKECTEGTKCRLLHPKPKLKKTTAKEKTEKVVNNQRYFGGLLSTKEEETEETGKRKREAVSEEMASKKKIRADIDLGDGGIFLDDFSEDENGITFIDLEESDDEEKEETMDLGEDDKKTDKENSVPEYSDDDMI